MSFLNPMNTCNGVVGLIVLSLVQEVIIIIPSAKAAINFFDIFSAY